MNDSRNNASVWNILIVDDETLVRDALASMLESTGRFRVVGRLARGDDAPEAARAASPHAVILDVEAPGRSAFDTARAIKAVAASTRIVFLSGNVHRRFLQEATDIGAAAYLSKSEPGSAIIDALERVRAGETVWPELSDLPPSTHDAAERLTPRELEVLKYISQGLSTREMADVMFLSPRTVERHVERLMSRLGIRDRLRLALYAFAEGLASVPSPVSASRFVNGLGSRAVPALA